MICDDRELPLDEFESAMLAELLAAQTEFGPADKGVGRKLYLAGGHGGRGITACSPPQRFWWRLWRSLPCCFPLAVATHGGASPRGLLRTTSPRLTRLLRTTRARFTTRSPATPRPRLRPRPLSV